MLIALIASAPASSHDSAISSMHVTFGLNFTIINLEVISLILETNLYAIFLLAQNSRPPSLTFGHEIFNSYPICLPSYFSIVSITLM